MFKGINQDVHPKYNKESYNYALNTNMESEATAFPYLNSDFGNQECIKVDGKIIGHCLDKDNNFILITNANKIYRQIDCSVTEITREKDYSCLNLGNSEYVEIVYTLLRGCEEIIYITDGINPYKFINLSNLPNNCSNMLYSPTVNPPKVLATPVKGGDVYAGTYFYTIRLIDEYGTPTNWFKFYNPVNVYSSNKSKLDDAGICKTDLAIQFNVTNIDENYSRYQIGVIEYSSFTGSISKVFILPENTSIYTGNNQIETTSVNDLLVNKLIVEVVGTHTKHLNRLFVGNLTYNELDYSVAQRIANTTTVNYVVTKHDKSQPVKTYRHNDVYDIGIVGTFANGKTTPVFHVPGRTKDIPLQGYNLTTIRHPNRGISNNIDSLAINNDLNLGICKDCKDLLFKYESTAKVELNKFKLNFSYLLTYNNAAVQITFKYNGNQQVFNTTGSNIHNIEFDYANSSNVEVIIEVTYKDCTWGSSIDLTYTKGYEADDIYLDSSNVQTTLIERWRLYNTALKHTTPFSKYFSSGITGYYEACERYPDLRDCNNVPIYPHRKYINPITSTIEYEMEYIRYHRMPDQLLEPIQDENNIYSIGVDVNLRQFKSELIATDPRYKDIIKWEVVYGQRDNKLVKDSGIMYQALKHKQGEKSPVISAGIKTDDLLAFMPQQGLFTGNKTLAGFQAFRQINNFVYFSPSTLYKDMLEGESIYINNRFSNNDWESKLLRTISQNPATAAPGIIESSLAFNADFFWKNTWAVGSELYASIDKSLLVSPVKHITDEDGGEYLGVEATMDNQVVRNMFYSNNVGFLKLKSHPGNHTYHIDLVTHGQPYNFQKTIYHFDTLGDAWISLFNFTIKQPGYIYKDNWQNILFAGLPSISTWIADGLGANIDRRTYFKCMTSMWIESDYNCSYRFSDSNPWESFLSATSKTNILRYLDQDRKQIGGTTEEDIQWEYFPDYNKINIDYSEFYSPTTKLKLPINYDLCSKCNDDLPNRIYYSEAAYIENGRDNFRSILVNNYQDLDTPINTLFKDRDELFARTNKYVYRLFTRETKLEANNSNIFIGTNELLTIPAQKTSSTEYTYGGAEHKLDIISTEAGTFYVSDNHIIHITDKVNILETGLRGFLKDNLRSTSPSKYKYTLAYDYRYNRIFISKIEYAPLYRNSIYKDGKWYQRQKNVDVYIPNQVYNDTLFENKSFTVSYNLLTNTFISFHSWIPEYSYFSNIGYFSQKGDQVYKHNTDNYLEYYNNDCEQIIDIPVVGDSEQSTINSVWTNIFYTQDNKDANTFLKYIAYNDNQSTGVVDLVPKTTIFNYHNLSRVENIFKVSLDRNSVNTPLFSTDWLDLKATYPIDKVSLPKTVFSGFSTDDLRSQYINIRLMYNNIGNIFRNRLSLDYISTIKLNSYR